MFVVLFLGLPHVFESPYASLFLFLYLFLDRPQHFPISYANLLFPLLIKTLLPVSGFLFVLNIPLLYHVVFLKGLFVVRFHECYPLLYLNFLGFYSFYTFLFFCVVYFLDLLRLLHIWFCALRLWNLKFPLPFLG